MEKEKDEYHTEIQLIKQKRESIKKNAIKLNFTSTNEKNVCVSENELETGMVSVSNETRRLIELKQNRNRNNNLE